MPSTSPAPALSSLRLLKILINRPEPEETAAELLSVLWSGRVAGTRQDKYSSTHRNESTTYFTIGRKYQLYILYNWYFENDRANEVV